MNRILLEELEENIEKDIDILLTKSLTKKINILKGNVNILFVLEETNDLNLDFNIYDGNLILNIISYNSKDMRLNINLLKENASVEINNSVIALNKQKIDININHKYKNTKSNINNYGNTIKDGSIIFNIISKVPKGIKNTIVNQSSKIIANNDTNENKINPVLLIEEYEVEAKHSAYIGNFNQNELFYLESRGLSKKEASNLLLKGILIGTLNIEEEQKELIEDKFVNEWR